MKEDVLDVLMYLFEAYLDADPQPEPDRAMLRGELEQAGFGRIEIDHALEWLDIWSSSNPRPRPRPSRSTWARTSTCSPPTATSATWCRRRARSTRSGFSMKYQVIDRNEKHVKAIAKKLKKADALYLATDPDREGEAISWHLYELLQEPQASSARRPVYRVVFNEITKRAVQDAVANPARAVLRTWSTPSRRAGRSTTWSASTSRRCCGRRSAAGSPPGVCRARRCA
jgi:5S rRNA maturation endonuclease (ribonuclease M5)